MFASDTARTGRFIAALAASCALACSAAREPCASPSCPAGQECLANRCVQAGSVPVRADTDRVVLEPVGIATASENGTSSLSPIVTFGSSAHGSSALYLRFDDDWKRSGSIDSAFLLLAPAEGTEPTREDVAVEALTVLERWKPGRVHWPTRPRVGLPRQPGIARAGPSQPLRIDVTELAREMQSRARDDGLAIYATASDGHGAAFATGLGAGAAPRLELYLRRR